MSNAPQSIHGFKFRRYIFHCTNKEAMLSFYTDILGWEFDIYNSEYRHLTYKMGEKYLVIMESPDAEEMKGWSRGPVFLDGNSTEISFSVKVEQGSKYREIVLKLQKSARYFWKTTKFVVNYWSFIVKDPMDLTLDVFYEPNVKPDSTVWQ